MFLHVSAAGSKRLEELNRDLTEHYLSKVRRMGVCHSLEPVLPQPLVQKSFYNLPQNIFPQNFLAIQTVEKIKKIQANLRQMYHIPYEKSSIITLPENLGKLSRVPSMKVSATHICFCSSRSVRCLIMMEGLNGRRR